MQRNIAHSDQMAMLQRNFSLSFQGGSVPAGPNPMTAVARESVDGAFVNHRGPLWTPDRGAGFYQTQRERQSSPSLISTGRSAFHLDTCKSQAPNPEP